jgi:hypothetical protein
MTVAGLSSGSTLTLASLALDSGKDEEGVGFPDEGLGLFVMFVENAIDGASQIYDQAKDTVLETPLGS